MAASAPWVTQSLNPQVYFPSRTSFVLGFHFSCQDMLMVLFNNESVNNSLTADKVRASHVAPGHMAPEGCCRGAAEKERALSVHSQEFP